MSKKIYVAYTGGTIGMHLSEAGYVPHPDIVRLVKSKCSSALKNDLERCEFYEYPQLIDSSNIGPNYWKRIASDILTRYEQYDGFVVVHGTDTMAYSCSMLSFMLQNLHKPVIFTGAQIPLAESDTDGLNNLHGAIKMAENHHINEVCVYFNGHLFRGNRTRKINSDSIDAFASPNYPVLNTQQCHMKVNQNVLWRPKGMENFNLDCDDETHVGIVHLFPGITDKWMESNLNQKVNSFILLTYGSGNGPDADSSLLNTISRAVTSGKLIVNLSQCYVGTVHNSQYKTGTTLSNIGIADGQDTTVEAMFCKLHYLYSQGMTTEKVRDMLSVSLSGEVSVND